jgi:ABC-type transporter Mla maintaining outer membrane lipid asymmetry ATPase subunit MlaF
MTSVLVTHQLSAAFQISNHFVFLYEGEILFEGAADELMTAKDPYIQRFIQPPSRSYRATDLVHF